MTIALSLALYLLSRLFFTLMKAYTTSKMSLDSRRPQAQELCAKSLEDSTESTSTTRTSMSYNNLKKESPPPTISSHIMIVLTNSTSLTLNNSITMRALRDSLIAKAIANACIKFQMQVFQCRYFPILNQWCSTLKQVNQKLLSKNTQNRRFQSFKSSSR